MCYTYRLITHLLITICICSCGKCPCIDGNLEAGFIGFSTTDVDTIIIRKYSKTNTFTTLIDTAFFDNKGSFNIQKSNDTVSFPVHIGNFSLNKNYDWVLFLPSINRTFKISNIVSPQVSLPCPNKVQCVNPINSLDIDGAVSVPYYSTFFIKK